MVVFFKRASDDGSRSIAGIRNGACSIVLQKYSLTAFVNRICQLFQPCLELGYCQLMFTQLYQKCDRKSQLGFGHGNWQDKLLEVIESTLPETKLSNMMDGVS